MKKKIINENQYQSISMQVLFQFVEYFRYLEFEVLPEAKEILRILNQRKENVISDS